MVSTGLDRIVSFVDRLLTLLPLFILAQIVVSANPDRWTRVNRQAARFWAIYLHLGELLEADGTGKPHLPNGVVSFFLFVRSELFLRMSVSFTWPASSDGSTMAWLLLGN
jgi:hypothetical protein